MATQLGQWTNGGTIQFLPGPTAGTLVGLGEVTFTAASGDTLHATIDGVLSLATGWRDVHVRRRDRPVRRGRGEAGSVILQNPDGSFAFTLNGVVDY